MNELRTIFAWMLFTGPLLSPRFAVAQSEPWLWPVEGLQAGEGILYTPQIYIDGELNFADLYIGAPEGTPVVAPADGVVESYGITYYYSQQYSIGSRFAPGDDLAEQIDAMAKELGGKEYPRYIHVSLCIRLPDGRAVWLGGLHGERIFRTGERVKRGDRLGTAGYAYKKIPESCIKLSVSTRTGSVDDPMSPFGLRTTFIPPKLMPEVMELTREEAAEDFNTLMRVLREVYPGLYDDNTPAGVDAFCEQTLASLPEKMTLLDFYRILRRVDARFHDSHLMLYPTRSEMQRRSVNLPHIYLGWIDSALVAVRCTRDYAAYYGRRVRSVDGIPADSVHRFAEKYARGYDAQVESAKVHDQALWASSRYFTYAPGASRKCDMTLEFDDGERLSLKGWTFTGRDLRGLAPDWTTFIRTNNYPDANFSARMLDDSTAYLGLSTFQLSDVEVDSIASFVRSAAGRPNMIVDVRNNPGGEVETLARILSYFADKPFASLGGYQWMPRRDSIAVFEDCCLNYSPTQAIVDGFERVEGREGYFSFEDARPILPDSVTNYRGRLYVLQNEGSCSAATIFPATILRNHRGVLVGRETATAYHFMNAFKFADIRLPHSQLTMRVPLVRCVFDTTENLRIPYGRGVLPDHEIGLSLAEMASERGDSILRYTLALIDRGEYLGDDPFAAEPASCRWLCRRCGLLFGGVGIAAAVAGLILLRRRRRA